MKHTKVILICLGSLFFVACPSKRLQETLREYSAPKEKAIFCCTQTMPVSIQYLGVGGVLIRAKGMGSVLTAPFFSNPSMAHLATKPIPPKTSRINRLLPPINDVQGILVGHSHYDHLLEVPYILKYKAPKHIKAFLNQSGKYTIQSAVKPSRLIVTNTHAAKENAPGHWLSLPDGKRWTTQSKATWRILPIHSSHAPHFAGLKLLKSEPITHPLPSLPTKADGWHEGYTMAFLIDVLDAAHKPIFRIYYNDAASYPTNEPNKRRWNGHLPPSILREKRIDVALLTGASFSQVKHYPEQLIRHLQPKHTIVIHWEDFFKNPERPLHQVKVVPFTDIDTFVKALQQASPTDAVPSKQAGWTLALPFQTIRFHPPTKR